MNSLHARVEQFVINAPKWINRYADRADVNGLVPIATGWFIMKTFPLEYTGGIGFMLDRNGNVQKLTVDIANLKGDQEVQDWADRAIRGILGI